MALMSGCAVSGPELSGLNKKIEKNNSLDNFLLP
jgi:hypothetical protein